MSRPAHSGDIDISEESRSGRRQIDVAIFVEHDLLPIACRKASTQTKAAVVVVVPVDHDQAAYRRQTFTLSEISASGFPLI